MQGGEYPVLSERRNIVFIADEAHRSQYDFIDGFARHMLDTAPAYGESEAKIGRAIEGQRNRWVICTKVGEYFEDGHSHHDFSRETTEASLTRSLANLKTDHLDMVLVHSTGEDAEVAHNTPVLDVLARWRDRGDIGAIGMSTKTVAETIALLPDLDAVMVTLNPAHAAEIR